jgi:AmiR/NasT family two-component response regulator
MTAARADFIPDSSRSTPATTGPSASRTTNEPATVTDMTERIAAKQILDHAKHLLMTVVNLTEPEAHRWIQKTAMDRRTGKQAIALGIIEALSEKI